jgi:hypothetical protein
MTLIGSAGLAAVLLSAAGCAKRPAATNEQGPARPGAARAALDSATIARLCATPESVQASARRGCVVSDQSVIPWGDQMEMSTPRQP